MFAKVTDRKGRIQWINLTHVRQLVVQEGSHGVPTLTDVHIDGSWVERVVTVVETPEEILGQAAD